MRKECIVSLESRDSVEACNLLRPWTLEEDTLMRLEYAWGLKYRTLKSSVEANTIYLTSELRSMFESDLWALLPLDVPLLKMIVNTDFTLEKPIETAYEGMSVFDYVLMPLPGMARTITRLVEQGSSPNPMPREHLFPYTTLPVLHLHVQPHYVVFDLVRKLIKHELLLVNDIRDDKGYEAYFSRYPKADFCCRCMYDIWISGDVPSSFIDDSEADTEGTAQGRTMLRKRRPETCTDKVGLRPTDSVTFIHDNEDGEDSSDDDADEFVVDESDSTFKARMTRWVAALQPGLTPPDSQPLSLDTMETGLPEATEDGSDGSPTMVGSILFNVDSKMDCIGESPTHDMDVPCRTKSISDMSLGSSALIIV